MDVCWSDFRPFVFWLTFQEWNLGRMKWTACRNGPPSIRGIDHGICLMVDEPWWITYQLILINYHHAFLNGDYVPYLWWNFRSTLIILSWRYHRHTRFLWICWRLRGNSNPIKPKNLLDASDERWWMWISLAFNCKSGSPSKTIKFRHLRIE